MDVDPKEPNTGIFWMFRKNGEIGHTGSDPGVTVIFFFNPETARVEFYHEYRVGSIFKGISLFKDLGFTGEFRIGNYI
jgi:hypothetical protein